jgi:hypothetical protein
LALTAFAATETESCIVGMAYSLVNTRMEIFDKSNICLICEIVLVTLLVLAVLKHGG